MWCQEEEGFIELVHEYEEGFVKLILNNLPNIIHVQDDDIGWLVSDLFILSWDDDQWMTVIHGDGEISQFSFDLPEEVYSECPSLDVSEGDRSIKNLRSSLRRLFHDIETKLLSYHGCYIEESVYSDDKIRLRYKKRMERIVNKTKELY